MKRVSLLTSLFIFVGAVGAQAPAQPPPQNSPFGGFGGGGTQPSRPSPGGAKKSGLEAAIDLALLNNPDLRVADAKVREAEASLSRARLQVLQKVVTAYQTLEEAKAAVKHAESGLARVKRLYSDKVGASAEEVRQAEVAVSAAKSKEASAQAELDYLQGKAATRKVGGFFLDLDRRGADPALFSAFSSTSAVTASGAYSDAVYSYTLKGRVEGPVADRLRKALERKVSVKVRETDARAFLAFLREQATGLHLQATERGREWDETVTANLSEVPLSTALQLLEDVLGDHRIVVRDYGLLVVTKSQVPPGALTLADFLRAGAAAVTKPDGK